MDGAPIPKAGGSGKAVLPVPAGAGASAATSSARVGRKAALPGGAAGAADAPAAATAALGTESNGGGEEEEEDDEQVERFYALLDNIRAMRGAYGSGSGDAGAGADGGVDTGGGGGARVKRLRASEPPWRPAFRLEDFEEPTPTSSSDAAAPCAKRRTARGAERVQTSR